MWEFFAFAVYDNTGHGRTSLLILGAGLVYLSLCAFALWDMSGHACRWIMVSFCYRWLLQTILLASPLPHTLV